MAINTLYPIQIYQKKINHRAIFKFGYNTSIGTTEATVWDQGGIYTYLLSASVLKLSSSDNSDTSTVVIYGLDENWNEISETIVLTGQTAVNTANSYIRIYRGTVISGQPLGNIYAGTGTVTAGVPANIFMKILATENQTLMAVWSVPAGYTGYIYQVSISSGSSLANKYIISRLKVREFGEVFRTRLVLAQHNTTTTFDKAYPTIVPEKSDIEIRAESSSGTDNVSATFTVVYVKNE